MANQRMPVAFIPHGGGPWPFVDIGLGEPSELQALAAYLRSLRHLPPAEPKAVLVVSAHWEEPELTVMTGEKPPLLFDYYGFPPESYELTWPAPGQPAVAARVRELLAGAGFPSGENAARGFDHGVFVPLKLTFPEADIPTVQLSLKRGLDSAEHLALGRALAPLRDEGIFIVGSGMTFHNLRAFRDPRSRPVSETFDAWLRQTATLTASERDRGLSRWSEAPAARLAHPREEHLLPLMVVAGAAGEDRGSVAFNGTLLGLRLSAYHFGAAPGLALPGPSQGCAHRRVGGAFCGRGSRRLETSRLRARLDGRNGTLSKRIAEAHDASVPFLAIIGKREAEARSVTLRPREGAQRSAPLAEALGMLATECESPFARAE